MSEVSEGQARLKDISNFTSNPMAVLVPAGLVGQQDSHVNTVTTAPVLAKVEPNANNVRRQPSHSLVHHGLDRLLLRHTYSCFHTATPKLEDSPAAKN